LMITGADTFWHGARLVRIAQMVAGIVLLWMALCLYEDDDLGKIIDILDRWWDRTKKIGQAKISRQAIFLREIARLAATFFDRLLGTKLLSLRCVGVTSSFSAASLLVSSLWPDPDLESIGIIAIFLILGLLPLLISKPIWIRAWFVLTFAAALFWAFFLYFLTTFHVWTPQSHYTAKSVPVAVFFVLIVVLLSFASDVAFIAFTRWLLAWTILRADATAILTVLLINVTLAFGLTGVPLILARTVNDRDTSTLLDLIGSTNIIDAIASGIWILFAIIILVHRLFWPVLSRTLYGLKSLGVLKWRKTLAIVGLILRGMSNEKAEKIISKVIDKML